jgi:hypothetical protein
VFVAKHRHDAAARLEHLHDLAEQPPLGVDGLPRVRFGVVAVLGHQQHAVDRQLVAAQRERLGHGVVNGNAVLLGQPAADIAVGHLVGVERDEFQLRPPPVAVERFGFQQSADNHVGMRVVMIRSHHRGDVDHFLRLRLSARPRLIARGRERRGHGKNAEHLCRARQDQRRPMYEWSHSLHAI